MSQTKLSTGIYGVNFTETFTVIGISALFELKFVPIISTLYFWRNGISFQPAFSLTGKNLLIEDLNISENIRINYTPDNAVDWNSQAANASPTFYFNYGDANPATIYTPNTTQIIKAVSLIILTTFNGVGAQISIGTDESPSLLMDTDESDVSIIGVFETNPNETILNSTQIKVFITPGAGATTGRAGILIEYATA